MLKRRLRALASLLGLDMFRSHEDDLRAQAAAAAADSAAAYEAHAARRDERARTT